MAKKKERKGLVFLIDQMKLVEDAFEPVERAEMYSALFRYATEGIKPQSEKFSRAWRAIFSMMSAAQDESKEIYDQMCERNRTVAAANKKGGCDTSRDESSPVDTSRDESSPVETSRSQDKIREDKIREDKRREDTLGNAFSDMRETGVPGVVWA